MKHTVKRLARMLLAISMILTLIPAVPAYADEPADGSDIIKVPTPHKYGLHVDENGTILLEGKPFYGFGINYFGAFAHYEDGSLSLEAVDAAFESIASHNIPLVRLPLDGYYANYYDRWDDEAQRAAILTKMHEVMDIAEKYHVGVVVSLMWWDPAMPEHLGAKRADMGDKNSAYVAYAKNYVSAVVSEFVNHPAVWGWEIGNEYNLDADLCDANYKDFLWADGLPGSKPTERNGYDYFTTEELKVFYAEISRTIRSIDDYRLITTGESSMRNCAFSLHKASRRPSSKHTWVLNWTPDNRSGFQKILEAHNGGDIDTISFHVQFGTGGSDPSYVLEFDVFNEKLSAVEYIRAYVDAARTLKKALFFGEFGDFIGMESAEDMPETFDKLCGWVEEAGVQVACLWQYQDYADVGTGALKYDILAERNRALIDAGKQDTSAAWLTYVVDPSMETESPTSPDSEAPSESVTETASDSGTTSESVAETASAETGCTSALAAAPLTAVATASACALCKKRKKAN